MEIKTTQTAFTTALGKVHMDAFGREKGPEIAALVKGLMGDDSATPVLSLKAVEDNRILGHILFTKVKIRGAERSVSARILAPLAVLPEVHGKGIGGALIKAGLERLKASGVDLVFVLGHTDYYPRSGFAPADVRGFGAPYPIPEAHAGAWMVQALSEGVIGRVRGTVQCSKALDRPEHWRE